MATVLATMRLGLFWFRRAAPGPSTPSGANVVVPRPVPAALPPKPAPPSDGDEAWQKLVDELDKP